MSNSQMSTKFQDGCNRLTIMSFYKQTWNSCINSTTALSGLCHLLKALSVRAGQNSKLYLNARRKLKIHTHWQYSVDPAHPTHLITGWSQHDQHCCATLPVVVHPCFNVTYAETHCSIKKTSMCHTHLNSSWYESTKSLANNFKSSALNYVDFRSGIRETDWKQTWKRDFSWTGNKVALALTASEVFVLLPVTFSLGLTVWLPVVFYTAL